MLQEQIIAIEKDLERTDVDDENKRLMQMITQKEQVIATLEKKLEYKNRMQGVLGVS